MKDSIRTIAKIYFVTLLWYVVVVATSFTAITLIDGSALFEESAALRAGLAMGIALLVASLTAATVWIKLRSTATTPQTEQRPLEDGLRSLPARETV